MLHGGPDGAGRAHAPALLVVMILTPGIMNAVQFWLVDNIFVHVKADPGVETGDYSVAPEESDAEQGALGQCSPERARGAASNTNLLQAQRMAAKASGTLKRTPLCLTSVHV